MNSTKHLYFNVNYANTMLGDDGYIVQLLKSLESKIAKLENKKIEHYDYAKISFWADLIEDEFRSVSDKLLVNENDLQLEKGSEAQWKESISKFKELRMQLDVLYKKLESAMRKLEEEDIKTSFKDYYMYVNSRYLYIKSSGKSRHEEHQEFQSQKTVEKEFRIQLEKEAQNGNKYLYHGIILGMQNTPIEQKGHFYGTLKTRFYKKDDGSWGITSNSLGIYPSFDKYPKIMNKEEFFNSMIALGVPQELIRQFEEAEMMPSGD